MKWLEYGEEIPVLRSQRQEDHEFGVSLGYTVKPCLKMRMRVSITKMQFYISGI
jgi:hypothetical protein